MTNTMDTLLAVATYVSALVATLRAGSRALYLFQNDQIGVMKGPPILGPGEGSAHGNGTTSVSHSWILAQSFRESVKLALHPEGMDCCYVTESSSEGDTPYLVSSPQVARVNETDESKTSVQEESHETTSGNFTFVSNPESTRSRMSLRQVGNFLNLPEHFARGLTRVPSRLKPITSYIWSLKKALGFQTSGRKGADRADEEYYEYEWDYGVTRSAKMTFNNSEASTTTSSEISVYAPATFADLRSSFGISETSYRHSILHAGPFISFQSNSKGAARAGGVFFFTRDGAYMIKTIKKEEAKTFLRMLRRYHRYMRRNGRKTLLTRVCGMYRIQLDESGYPDETLRGKVRESIARLTSARHQDDAYVLVMNSVFPAESSQFISERYDIKGSTVGRRCSDEEKSEKGSNAVLKDLDLANEVALVRSFERSRFSSHYGIHIGPTAKSALLSQLRRDVKLLVECEVMDYSLLVGVVNMNPNAIDLASLERLQHSQQQETRLLKLFSRNRKNSRDLERLLLTTAITPLRIMSAPAVFFARRLWSAVDSTVSTVLTLPLPYYGAGLCGVYGGSLSMMRGTRHGKQALFYLGLIDFLQPWTSRKVAERQFKRLMGSDVHAISCVAPEEYAARFLEFIDAHVS